jgi:site-specific DNA-cytosine methylase
MRAIDVHGFGGSFTLGVVQAGFDLTAKFSLEKGFGVYNTLANRHLLGYEWDSIAAHPSTWEVMPAELVFGNPPCSGFSTLSRKEFRGIYSKANSYMWELAKYAGQVAPEVIIFESVQLTFRQGLELMRMLHTEVEEISGHSYTLYHVLHNNASVGGGSTRRRYFWVASRIPFGVDHYPLEYVPVFGDLLKDLEPLALTMNTQRLPGAIVDHTDHCRYAQEDRKDWDDCHCSARVLNSSRWAREHMHDGTGTVDGHQIQHTPLQARCRALVNEPWSIPWEQGESLTDVLAKCYVKHGDLPEEWKYEITGVNSVRRGGPFRTKAEELIALGFPGKQNDVTRWRADKLARVITGGGAVLIWHPTLERTLTQRELARIQGFPDAWRIHPVRNAPDLGPGWGKGVPVHTGKWIADYARKALEGMAGSYSGITLQEYDKKLFEKFGPYKNEFVIDFTNDYKPFALALGDRG